MPGRFAVDQELRQPVPAVFLGRRRGAQQRDHVVGIMRVAGPDLAAVDQPAALGLGRAGRGGEHVGAGIGLRQADAEAEFARGDARQDRVFDLAAGRSAGSSGRSAGRRSRRRGSGRGAPASPRSRHSVRETCARGRRTASARSCRSSRARRPCGRKPWRPGTASAPNAARTCRPRSPERRKSRTSWRSSSHSGGRSTGSKWKL